MNDIELEKDIACRLIKIIKNNIDEGNNINDIKMEDDLMGYGVNSIIFIKIVVGIENEFRFEFDNEALDSNLFPNTRSLVTYIKDKIMRNL